MSFSFNLGLFRAFMIENLSLKNWEKVRLTAYQNANFLAKNRNFSLIFFGLKNVLKWRKIRENSITYHFLLL